MVKKTVPKTPEEAERASEIERLHEASKKRDKWFMEMMGRKLELPKVKGEEFFVPNPRHRIQVTPKEGGESILLTIPPGRYKKSAHIEALKAEKAKGGILTKDRLEAAMATAREPMNGLLANESGGGTGLWNPKSGTIPVDASMRMPGHVIAGTPFERIGGKVAPRDEVGGLLTEKQYLEAIPFIDQHRSRGNPWTKDFPDPSLGSLQASAWEVMAHLKNLCRGLPAIDIYTIQARWLRYYSDGSMTTQHGGVMGVRDAPQYPTGTAPLLYDGPAFVVGLRARPNEATPWTYLPGRVFVNEEGHFLCSDWCQREVDKGGGIDLITGLHTKHTLATWVGSCAMQRDNLFGGVAAARNEQVIRYRPKENLTPAVARARTFYHTLVDNSPVFYASAITGDMMYTTLSSTGVLLLSGGTLAMNRGLITLTRMMEGTAFASRLTLFEPTVSEKMNPTNAGKGPFFIRNSVRVSGQMGKRVQKEEQALMNILSHYPNMICYTPTNEAVVQINRVFTRRLDKTVCWSNQEGVWGSPTLDQVETPLTDVTFEIVGHTEAAESLEDMIGDAFGDDVDEQQDDEE